MKQRKNNPLIPKIFQIKEDQKCLPQTFGIQEETNSIIPKSSKLKRDEKVYSKTFFSQEKN
jgi:hypothetical protein